MMNGKILKRVCIIFLLVCVFMLSGCTFLKKRSIEKYLASGDMENVVQYYNEKIYSMEKESRQEIDSLVINSIEELVIDDNAFTEEYLNVKTKLEQLKAIYNPVISEKVKYYLTYITREHDGNLFLEAAEKCFKEENYLEAMQYLEKGDTKYSQYELLKAVYDDSKLFLLQQIGHPSTISEYETAISMLEDYQKVIEDEDFALASWTLREELAECRSIQRILLKATEYFEKGFYKDSFDHLEEGLLNHPENKKIKYALASYQYAFVMETCCEVIDLIDSEYYEAAESKISSAIALYDCEEFQELSETVRVKTDFLFSFKTHVIDAGKFIFNSAKKMLLGDFAEDEQETLLSLGGSVAASIANVDAPLDIRDLAYDLSHWGQGDYFAARLALDAIGIIPVVGAIKYLKHADTVSDSVKGTNKATDAIDTVHDLSKTVDSVNDTAKALERIVDSSEIVSDVRKKADTVLDLSSDFSEFERKSDIIDDISDGIKKSKHIATNNYDNMDTATDVIDDTINHYVPICTVNQHLIGKTCGESEITYVRRYIDLSDGRSLTGVFPDFEAVVEIELPKEYWNKEIDVQETYLENRLREIAGTPSGLDALRNKFDSESEIEKLSDGIIPDGYVWHYSEQEGLIQLVDEEKHLHTPHTEGKDIWGDLSSINSNLTTVQVTAIQKESNIPELFIKYFKSWDEYMIYKGAGLRTEQIGDQLALIQKVDLEITDDFGMTNAARIRKGLSPIDEKGNAYELHHIGQDPDSPLAILTREQHRQGDNNKILHIKTESEVEHGNEWQKQVREFWKNYLTIYGD